MNVTPLFICRLLKQEPVSPWKELIDSLENNPFDWVTNSCTVDNENNKTRFWIGNGYPYFKIYRSLTMELPDKTQKEMSEAIKIMAVSAFTEKSQNLIPLDYVAALVGCPYQHTANFIVKQPSFPKGVRLKEKSHPRWIAGEVIRWCRINAKRIK